MILLIFCLVSDQHIILFHSFCHTSIFLGEVFSADKSSCRKNLRPKINFNCMTIRFHKLSMPTSKYWKKSWYHSQMQKSVWYIMNFSISQQQKALHQLTRSNRSFYVSVEVAELSTVLKNKKLLSPKRFFVNTTVKWFL